MRIRPKRQPTAAMPATQARSKMADVPCEAGRSSQRPVQPVTATAGT